MRDVLKEYDDAVREKGSEIRNLAAYLFGVVKRYKSLHERAMTGDNTLPQGRNLSPRVSVSILFAPFSSWIIGLDRFPTPSNALNTF